MTAGGHAGAENGAPANCRLLNGNCSSVRAAPRPSRLINCAAFSTPDATKGGGGGSTPVCEASLIDTKSCEMSSVARCTDSFVGITAIVGATLCKDTMGQCDLSPTRMHFSNTNLPYGNFFCRGVEARLHARAPARGIRELLRKGMEGMRMTS